MPKVLRILNRFNLGGPTYNAVYLTKYLAPDYETLLIGGIKDDCEGSSEYMANELGIEPLILPEMKRAINLKQDRLAYNKIKQIINDFKPDIVHTHASKAGTLGRLAAFSCNVPYVYHTFHGHVLHSYFNPFKTFIIKSIERYLARRSTTIIAISEKQKEELCSIHKICKKDKVTVIPLGFDLSRFQTGQEEKRKAFRTAYHLDEDEIAVGIIGRLVPIKNHALFLNALKQVQKKTTKRVRAFIIGDGESREELEQKAKELSLPFVDSTKTKEKALLTFTSWIHDIASAYAGLDIITLTSINEGTPVSLIEAQAANKPIVTTNVGGIEDVVVPNTTALLSKHDDVNGFAYHLLSLIEDDEKRISMGIKGREHVNEKYNYLRLVKDMDALYKQAIV